MKPSHRSLSVLIPSSLICALLTGCGGDPAPEPETFVRPIKIFTVSSGGLLPDYEYPGVVEPALKANMAFEVPGRLIAVKVKEGEVVEEGTVLAELDPADYVAQLNAAKAVLEEAESERRRNEVLFEKDAVSKETLEKSVATAETARAQLDVSQKAYEDTFLRAPFTGEVARVLVEDFGNLQAKEVVMILQDTTSLKAVIDIPETLWARADKGSTYEESTERIKPTVVLTSMPDQSYPARISEMATTADPATRTFAVTFVFTPSETINVSPGMTAKITFGPPEPLTSKAGGIPVPVNSVAYGPSGEAFIWMVAPDTMTTSKLSVTVGEMAEGMIEVYGELTEGDLIAASGIANLREGTQVKAWEE